MDPAAAAVAANPLRPRRTSYLVAALIAVGCVLAAPAVLFLIPAGGDLGQRITPGQPVTVHVPEAGKMVWAKDRGPQELPRRWLRPLPGGHPGTPRVGHGLDAVRRCHLERERRALARRDDAACPAGRNVHGDLHSLGCGRHTVPLNR